jgi:hypothetical protein
MTRFVAHPTPVGGQLNYAFDEGKDAGGCGMPAKVTSGSAAARLLYPNNAIDARFLPQASTYSAVLGPFGAMGLIPLRRVTSRAPAPTADAMATGLVPSPACRRLGSPQTEPTGRADGAVLTRDSSLRRSTRGLPCLVTVLRCVWALRARPLPLARGLEVRVGLLRHCLNRNRDPFQSRNRSRVYFIDVH